MSFILDALRKSETERQRQATPSLADAQYNVNRKKRSIWVPALIALLAANLIIIAYVLFDDSPGVGDMNSPAMGLASEPVERAEVVLTEERIPDIEQPAKESVIAEATATAEKVAAVSEPEFVTEIPEIESTTVSVSPELGNLPTMQQLIQSGQMSLSPLHVDIHVFAGQPEKRFIFINMTKYREGDRLDEGPTVEFITSTGVVLQHQGNRFRLDRE